MSTLALNNKRSGKGRSYSLLFLSSRPFWTVVLIFGASLLLWGSASTVGEDHRRMLDMLGIVSIPPAPDLADRQTYDETRANPYPGLPDPLLLRDGRRVKDVRTWKQRRAEIIADFEREIFGVRPGALPRVTWEVISVNRTGSTSSKRLVGHVDNKLYPQIRVDIQASLIIPADAGGAVPVIMHFLGGRAPADPTRAIVTRPQTSRAAEVSAAPASPSTPLQISPQLVESLRIPLRPVVATVGVPAGRTAAPERATVSWQEEILSRGWGYATLQVDSIQADDGAGLTSGIIGLAGQGQSRGPSDWGAVSAWSWGASRLLDYLETDRAVNKRQVGIAGHSRVGKAALLAMALDERFAIAFVSSSGTGGAKLMRRRFGETVDSLASAAEYHLFAGNFLKYAGRWADLPVDAHQLLALAAPRPVFIGAGRGVSETPFAVNDAWTDPRGAFLAGVAATPVYELFGKKGLEVSDLPPIRTPLVTGEIAFRQHGLGHTDGPNLPAFLTFGERYLKSKSPLAGFWTWTMASGFGPGRSQGAGLMLKIGDGKVNGRWIDPASPVSMTDLEDLHLTGATTITFKQCYGYGSYVLPTSQQTDPEWGKTGSYLGFIPCSSQLNLFHVITTTGEIDGNELRLTSTVLRTPHTRTDFPHLAVPFTLERVDYCRNTTERNGNLILRENC